MKQVPVTLGYVLFKRVGFLKAGRALGLLCAWTAFLEATGEDPSQDRLAGFTGRSQASYSRDLVVFRECFPGEASPARLAHLLRDLRAAGLGPELRDFDLAQLPVTDLGSLVV